MYIDTGSPVLYIPSKSRDPADENNKKNDGMEMIRNNRIVLGFKLAQRLYHVYWKRYWYWWLSDALVFSLQFTQVNYLII